MGEQGNKNFDNWLDDDRVFLLPSVKGRLIESVFGGTSVPFN